MSNEGGQEDRKALGEAVEKLAETVNRAMLTLIAVCLFCLLTAIGSPDYRLLAPEASIKVPFTESLLSFEGFLIVGPLLLVALTIYLHIFYDQWLKLDAERRARGFVETYPALFGVETRSAKLLTGIVFYWLSPVVLGVITAKAAARIDWALPIGWVTALTASGLLYRQVRGWRSKYRLASLVSLVVVAGGVFVVVAIGTVVARLHPQAIRRHDRPLNLFRVQLKEAWLPKARLRGADLRRSNLDRANLSGPI
jgi:hypothetical protein